MFFHFMVRFDKQRNTMAVVAIKDVNKKDWFYFKYEDQPIRFHSSRVQSILSTKTISTTRVIPIELRGFDVNVYFDGEEFSFNGVVLNGGLTDCEKISNRQANKIIGQIKRKATLEKKKKVQQEKNELDLVKERQKEIAELTEKLVMDHMKEKDAQTSKGSS